jgi:hypothetical protein
MRKIGFIFTGVFMLFASCVVMFNYVLEAEPNRATYQRLNAVTPQSNVPTKVVKVEGIDYLVVESRNGIGVTFLVNKNNLKKLGQLVSEISDEMDAEKLNSIIQK